MANGAIGNSRDNNFYSLTDFDFYVLEFWEAFNS